MTSKEWIKENGKNYDNRAEIIRCCSDALDINLRNARKAMKLLENEGFKLGIEVKETKFENKNLAHLEKIFKVPHTVEELMEISELDPKLWDVSKQSVTFWGNEESPNYRIKADFKRIIPEEAEDFLNELIEKIENKAPKYQPIKYLESSEDSYMLEIDIFDPHFGMVTNEMNLDVTATRFYNSVCRILSWYKDKKIEKILFPVGNDILNSDVLGSKTSNDTHLEDEHPLGHKTYETAFNTLVKTMELCKTVAPVEIVAVYGNHDKASTFFLLHALEAYFRNCKEITVVNHKDPFYFINYGTNLIGLTHGTIKQKDLPLIMATNADPDFWRNSAKGVRQWRLGHLHHKVTKDVMIKSITSSDDLHGVRISLCSALTDVSFWAQWRGYKSIKECSGTLWHKKLGDISNYSFKYNKGEV